MGSGVPSVPVSEDATPPGLDLLGWASRLAEAPSGIAFIYEVLDLLAERYGFSDAVLAVETTSAARQAFRLRRARVSPEPSDTVAWSTAGLAGPLGLRTRPDGAVPPAVADYVSSLATAALALDLSRHDAAHDPLTGLPNRRAYERALLDAAGRLERYGLAFTLILIDLDDFKFVNDRLGHSGGDDALRALGHMLRSVTRSGDLAARVGGDEFALIVVDRPDEDGSHPILTRLRSTMVGLELSFSSGLAAFPTDADDLAALQRLADERLYAAKAHNRVGVG